MPMFHGNVQCRHGLTNGLHVAVQAAYGCPGVPMAACGVHMAAQRPLVAVLGAACGYAEAPWMDMAGSWFLLCTAGQAELTMERHSARHVANRP